MKSVKTAKGRTLDLEALARQNQNTKAVGNGRMNANGDEVDGRGNIIKSVQQKQKEVEKATTPAQESPATDPLQTPESHKPKKVKISADDDLDKELESSIINETEKTDEDGQSYLEIEYEDGSIETKEMPNE